MGKKIVIDIHSDGSVMAETFNIHGVTCMDELDKLLNNLSNEVQTTKKDDFYNEKVYSIEDVKVNN